LKKQRAGASFKAIKLKLGFGFGFDEDFWFRWSIRQAVSETMIIMVDANHACDATAAISRPHTRLRSIASANDPMTYVLRAKSPLFARSREIDPPDRLGGGGKEIPPPSLASTPERCPLSSPQRGSRRAAISQRRRSGSSSARRYSPTLFVWVVWH
jgi:hypothetical protein